MLFIKKNKKKEEKVVENQNVENTKKNENR